MKGYIRRLPLNIFALVLLFSVLACSSVPDSIADTAKARRLILQNASVIDPRNGVIRQNVSIEIDGGRIVSIAATSELASEKAIDDAEFVDLRGKFVVPGYNDMHTHSLQGDDQLDGLTIMLTEGITGFRQMAGSDSLLEARKAGALPISQATPKLLALSGKILTPFHGAKPNGVREIIAHQKSIGADFIKIGLIPAESFWAALAAAQEFGLRTAGHLQVGVDPIEASNKGFSSIEHLGTGNSLLIACSSNRDQLFAEDALNPAVKPPPFTFPYMEEIFMFWLDRHLATRTVSEEAGDVSRLERVLQSFDRERCRKVAKVFAENKTWNTPTLVGLREHNLAYDAEVKNGPMRKYMSASDIDIWDEKVKGYKNISASVLSLYNQYYEKQVELVKIFSEAGVPMMTGTDSGSRFSPSVSLSEEFTLLAKAGLSPLTILQMTTINPALFLGKSDVMGLVDKGYEADLVILDRNPLENAANLNAVASVVRSGFFYSREMLEQMKLDVEARRRKTH